jgi:hypothetical protein
MTTIGDAQRPTPIATAVATQYASDADRSERTVPLVRDIAANPPPQESDRAIANTQSRFCSGQFSICRVATSAHYEQNKHPNHCQGKDSAVAAIRVPKVRQRAQKGRGGGWLRYGKVVTLGLVAMDAAQLVALAQGSASPIAPEAGGDNPLSALAKHYGLPAGLVLVAGLVWAVVTNADKVEKVIGWLQGKEKAKPAANTQETSDQSGSSNQGTTVQAGDHNTINIQTSAQSAPAPIPMIPGGRLTNLPAERPGFLVRAAELQQFAAELAPEVAQVVIHSLPGVGKTTLALNYAHSASASYPAGVWWLDASLGFEPMVLEAVSELKVRIPGLGIVEGMSLEARLRRCFQAWPGEEGEPVLLVVDNLPSPGEGGVAMVERLTTGLPRRFRCLFTQRALQPKTMSDLKLPVLASEEALELLRLQSGESGCQRIAREDQQARLLVEEMGRLPLALLLLGGRLERVPSLTVSGLLEDLSQSLLEEKPFSERNAVFLSEGGLVATLLSS